MAEGREGNSGVSTAGQTLPIPWQCGSRAIFLGCWGEATCHRLAVACSPVQAASRAVAPKEPLGLSEEVQRMEAWLQAATGSRRPQPPQWLLAALSAAGSVPRDRWPDVAKPIGAAASAAEAHPAPQRLKANSYFKNKTTLCFAPFDTY